MLWLHWLKRVSLFITYCDTTNELLAAGEGAIMPHVMGIMRMLLSLSPLSKVRSKSLGPAFALIELAKNGKSHFEMMEL